MGNYRQMKEYNKGITEKKQYHFHITFLYQLCVEKFPFHCHNLFEFSIRNFTANIQETEGFYLLLISTFYSTHLTSQNVRTYIVFLTISVDKIIHIFSAVISNYPLNSRKFVGIFSCLKCSNTGKCHLKIRSLNMFKAKNKLSWMINVHFTDLIKALYPGLQNLYYIHTMLSLIISHLYLVS